MVPPRRPLRLGPTQQTPMSTAVSGRQKRGRPRRDKDGHPIHVCFPLCGRPVLCPRRSSGWCFGR
eukprot:5455958-Pyramimonas_sp.AAC.1